MRENTENLIIEKIENLLSEKLGKQIKVKNRHYLGGGCINNAMRLETDNGLYFFKWNRHCPEDLFVREAESLIELEKAKNEHLRIPGVVLSEKTGNLPGFIVMEYLSPGRGTRVDEIKLGKGLAQIHLLKNDRFGFYHDNYCGSTPQDNTWNTDWIDFFGKQRLMHLIKLIQNERNLPYEHVSVYEKLIEKLPGLIPEKSIPVIIHGDLWSGNYMFTDRGPALIDPAAYYADREMEMAIMTMFGGFSQTFWSAYNEINPLPQDWESRNRLYQIYHILNHYYLFGGGYGPQAYQAARYYTG